MTQQSIPLPRVRILITGGIGSGKSTVTARLQELGARVVEADRIGHEVLEPGGAAHQAVADRWPEAVREGAIDRGALARIVFSDESELRVLESLTHPSIAVEIHHRVTDADERVVAVELPIGVDLVGSDWIRVVVEAPEKTRLERAIERGFDEDDVRRRMAVQTEPEEWRSQADYVIVNDGTLEDLNEAVDELWERLTESRESRVESRDPVD